VPACRRARPSSSARRNLAVAERDLEVEEVEVALVDEQRDLAELALVLTDGDRVLVDLTVNVSLSELDPSLGIPFDVGARARCERAPRDHDGEQ